MLKKLTKVNRASGTVEATAAIALLLAVSFYVAVQDSVSMMQAQRDAKQAAAILWLENEVALGRSSLSPWATNADGSKPHLALYPLAAGASNSASTILIGSASQELVNNSPSLKGAGVSQVSTNDYFAKFKGTAIRSCTSISGGTNAATGGGGYGGASFVNYTVSISIQNKLVQNGTGPTNEVISRSFSRVFNSQ